MLPERQFQNLKKIKTSADHLLSLINQVLDLSKIEAGKTELHVTEFDGASILAAAINTAEPLVQGKPVNLVLNRPEEPIPLKSDREKISQIIFNLVGNACKFTEEGEIIITASVENDWFSVSVSDTGIGISEERLAKVFDDFVQAESSTTRKYGGTGLGLTISDKLAELLGGALKAESVLGKGSTFTLKIPVTVEIGNPNRSTEV